MILRSLLFVPGDSERKLARGADSGADALILDLEDSVAPERKAAARGLVCEHLGGLREGPALWVRINPMGEGGLDDLVAVVRAAPSGLVVPKVEHPRELAELSLMLDALERRDGVSAPIRLLAGRHRDAARPAGARGLSRARRCRGSPRSPGARRT